MRTALVLWTCMIFLSLFEIGLTDEEAHCDAAVYGRVSEAECTAAFRAIPSVATHHLFCEPQYIRPAFGAIRNRYLPNRIVQIPKIFRRGNCRIAIMSFAKHPGFTPGPLFGATWQVMNFRAGQNVLVCAHVHAMGGYSIVDLDNYRPDPQAVIYVYASGSRFEKSVNMYMQHGLPIVIPGWRPDGGLQGNLTVSESAYSGSATDLTAPEATVATPTSDTQQGVESTSAATIPPTVEEVQVN